MGKSSDKTIKVSFNNWIFISTIRTHLNLNSQNEAISVLKKCFRKHNKRKYKWLKT